MAGYNGGPYGYAGNGYGNYAGAGGVGIFDRQATAPYAAWSDTVLLTKQRRGRPVIRGYRTSDATEHDIYARGPNGTILESDLRDITGWNLVGYSDDMRITAEAGSSRPWTNTTTGVAVAAVGTSAGNIGPNGRNATRIQLSLNGGTLTGDVCRRVNATTAVVGVPYTTRFYVRSYDGVATYTIQAIGATGTPTSVAVTGDWQEVVITANAGGTSVSFGVGLRGAATPTNSNVADILVSEFQVERASAFSTYDPRPTAGAGNLTRVTCHEQYNTGMDLIQSTQNLQPLLVEQGVPCTDGSGKILAKYVAASSLRSFVNDSTALFNFMHTTGGTVVVVSRCNDDAATKVVVGTQSGNTAAGFRIQRPNSELLSVVSARIDVDGSPENTQSASVSHEGSGSTSLGVVVSQIDPDNATAASRIKSWINGSAAATNNALTGTPFVENSSGNFTVGAFTIGSGPFDGRIGSTIIYDTPTLPTAEREAVEGYFVDLHGIV